LPYAFRRVLSGQGKSPEVFFRYSAIPYTVPRRACFFNMLKIYNYIFRPGQVPQGMDAVVQQLVRAGWHGHTPFFFTTPTYILNVYIAKMQQAQKMLCRGHMNREKCFVMSVAFLQHGCFFATPWQYVAMLRARSLLKAITDYIVRFCNILAFSCCLLAAASWIPVNALAQQGHSFGHGRKLLGMCAWYRFCFAEYSASVRVCFASSCMMVYFL